MNQRLDFFDLPRCRKMQQYEALRAYHYEQCSVEEAAARGGYTPGSFRNLLTRFKKQPKFEFFWPHPTPSTPTPKPENPRVARILELRRQGGTITEIQTILNEEGIGASVGYIQNIFTQEGIRRLPPRRTRLQSPRTIADRRQLDLSPRTFRTDFAGLFLFAFDLVRMNVDEILDEVQMPGTRMIPALSGVLSLLALKLSGIGRPSQVMAEPLDQGLALFTGLNVIPKKSTLTEYSIEVDPAFAAPLMHRWYHAATNIAEIIGGGQSIDLDFHTMGIKPYLRSILSPSAAADNVES
ncbi:MAG: hypothetical protein F4100_03540 [Rhodothermaceae bacterium]|nr:hypothetical protein [Rhodothermaceae bacterium]MXW32214.1 hypothetical protein [Rhodothermaceae bacterium]MYE63854.1 hypothetical protein [Rhodothermaceae bacterium]MYJ19811.1 hypothetical protein [Rhodothermaceae bacterium]